MRISLIASTLCTVSLMAGAAFAEGPHAAMDKIRAHGDVVDKTYSAVQTGRAGFAGIGQPAPGSAHASTHSRIQRGGESRINCSDTGADCHSAAGALHGTSMGAGAAGASVAGGGSSLRPPPFLDKILGSDRTNFNEAPDGQDEGMSPRAAKRAWGGHGASGHQSVSAAAPGAGAHQGDSEKADGGGSGRMSCNEADECSMANKDVKKIWASASAKAGDIPSAARQQRELSNAARRIAEQRRAEGVAQSHAGQQPGAGSHQVAGGQTANDAH